MRYYWKLWAMSPGERASEDPVEADKVAMIRSVVVLVNFLTCSLLLQEY